MIRKLLAEALDAPFVSLAHPLEAGDRVLAWLDEAPSMLIAARATRLGILLSRQRCLREAEGAVITQGRDHSFAATGQFRAARAEIEAWKSQDPGMRLIRPGYPCGPEDGRYVGEIAADFGFEPEDVVVGFDSLSPDASLYERQIGGGSSGCAAFYYPSGADARPERLCGSVRYAARDLAPVDQPPLSLAHAVAHLASQEIIALVTWDDTTAGPAFRQIRVGLVGELLPAKAVA